MEDKLKPCPFESRISKSDTGCWMWTGAVQSRGYGNFRGKLAHRVSYEKYVKKIHDGLTIDHLCRQRLCVNPAHLEPVTHYINNMRGNTFGGLNKRKTHCSNGHVLCDENIKIVIRKDGARRKCMVCEREYKKEKRNAERK